MKKTEVAEDAVFIPEQFEITDHGALAIKDSASIETVSGSSNNAFLDNFLIAIKWLFLFIPGAAVLHVLAMGGALLSLYNDWSLELGFGMVAAAIAATFMIMLGMGKVGDLKYLRVVVGIAASSALAAIVYSVLTVLIPGDFFGIFTRATLPLTLLIGYLIKRSIDRMPSDDMTD